MKRVIEMEAFAKINIGLEIGSPRQDGYHSILGIFHSVGISDKLVVSETESSGIVVEGSFDCLVEETTVFKAAKLFLRDLGLQGGFKISVEKHIPVKAGLGGGSVDAAATIMALDRLNGTALSSGELASMAGLIGADVPFFLSGGAAIVSGKGDLIESIPSRNDFGILLVYPGFGVSTKWAYAELDSMRHAGGDAGLVEDEIIKDPTAKAILASAFRQPVEEWTFRNSFDGMLRSAFPIYRRLETMLRESGALFVSITGSGSCLYGVYGSMNDVYRAERMLRASSNGLNGENTLYGMVLHAIKPLETSLLLG
jgi:4-diphosphocytidyl-2-C-methyl-D-erythritol kinase